MHESYRGALLMIALITLTGFPLIFGYSTLLTLCGYIYGFPLGFTPAYLGAVFGSVACFLVGKRFFKERARLWLSQQYPTMTRAIETAVERGGLKVIYRSDLQKKVMKSCAHWV